MRTSTLFGAKNSGFFEIYCVSARTREEGVAPEQTRGERWTIFANLCGRPLWTVDGPLCLKYPLLGLKSRLVYIHRRIVSRTQA